MGLGIRQRRTAYGRIFILENDNIGEMPDVAERLKKYLRAYFIEKGFSLEEGINLQEGNTHERELDRKLRDEGFLLKNDILSFTGTIDKKVRGYSIRLSEKIGEEEYPWFIWTAEDGVGSGGCIKGEHGEHYLF